ncbi:SDR family oxidoreductase [Chloroflexota bacterium]
MSKQFEDRVALVTGAAAGIGRAAATAFAREGAKVVVSDVDVQGATETVQLILENGGAATLVEADVSQASQVEALMAETVETYGRLDCAFNNAGIGGNLGATADCEEENWDRVIAINLKGVWLCMKYEIPQMIKQGGGAIVNTASAAGLVALPDLPAYTASKHGVVGLTRSAAFEYARIGIRINVVCPGTIRTAFSDNMLADNPDLLEVWEAEHPIGRIGRPEEVAAAVLWLCSDAASFVTGHPLSVDGGLVSY